MARTQVVVLLLTPWACSAFLLPGSGVTPSTSTCGSSRKWFESARFKESTLAAATAPVAPAELDEHIAIDEGYPQLTYLRRSPDVLLIDNFLNTEECDSIIERAKSKGLSLSPVAYAGWTQDATELLKLAAGGPAVWAALARVWLLNSQGEGLSRAELAVQAGSTWAVTMLLMSAAVAAYTAQRVRQLQGMRTSTSTTLDGTGLGDAALVRHAAQLLQSDWRTFEAPTVIHYEPGQRLAPHFDANRAATLEDEERGGQTICTLLVYCNDVQEGDGGATIFNRLGLSVQPQRGQALLFFPATRDGAFDERVEHEGLPPAAEKWVARIWRHQSRVRPPYGLPDGYELQT